MLHDVKDLFGYVVRASDGDIGSVHDLYFDDDDWTARYLVVDTGDWFTGHRVLLSPDAVQDPDWYSRTLPVSMTREQIENSPDIDTAKPISRQQEIAYRGHFGWTPYWGIGLVPAPVLFPTSVQQAEEMRAAEAHQPAATQEQAEDDGDPNLRSVREVSGYRIEATDGEIGHVESFIVETGDWKIRYLVVDTKNWLPGKKVVISPQWVAEIDFAAGQVVVEMTKNQIENAPEFDPSAPVNRAYEERLYDYYGRPVYWQQ